MTIGALLPAYRELLTLHVISAIVWMAGMIMLPAIYARHVATTRLELTNWPSGTHSGTEHERHAAFLNALGGVRSGFNPS